MMEIQSESWKLVVMIIPSISLEIDVISHSKSPTSHPHSHENQIHITQSSSITQQTTHKTASLTILSPSTPTLPPHYSPSPPQFNPTSPLSPHKTTMKELLILCILLSLSFGKKSLTDVVSLLHIHALVPDGGRNCAGDGQQHRRHFGCDVRSHADVLRTRKRNIPSLKCRRLAFAEIAERDM